MQLQVDRQFKQKTISYDLYGEGLPLLCLSGFGCSNYNYEYLKVHLGAHYQLIMIDGRGMGKSSPVQEAYALEDLALDAILVMKKLGISKFHVMGISMGGFVAQIIAKMYPENTEKLILACTTSSGSEFPKLQKLTAESIKKSYDIPRDLAQELICKATIHPTLSNRDFFKILKLRIDNEANLQQLLLQQVAIDQFFSSELRLEDIKAITLVITGEEDRFVDPVSSDILVKKIRNSTLVKIPQSDHHFFLEKPKEVADEIISFLGEKICLSH